MFTGMTSLFKLDIITSCYIHIKVPNERIWKWGHCLSSISGSQDICTFKVWKRGDSLGRFYSYGIPEIGEKISNFLSFQNCFSNSLLALSLEQLDWKR